MYSVVLVAALATAGDLPAGRCGGGCGGGHHGHRHGRHGGGCGGGYGGCGGGCYGGGCYGGGCYGGGCYGGGCYGGGCYGGGCAGGVCYGMSAGYGMAVASADTEAPATIVVSLPEDATLSIDDSPTTSTSGQRTFVSPALAAGKDFHYVLKAEVMRDGKAVTIEKTVTVRAGEETRVNLETSATGVASR